MLASQRRRMLQMLAEYPYVTIHEIRDATGVSMPTIHRDLHALAASGALLRIRGGAARAPGRHVDALLSTCQSTCLTCLFTCLSKAQRAL